MPPVKRGPPPNGKPLRRTFPTKSKPGSTDNSKKKGMPSHIKKKLEMKKANNDEQNAQKKDEMIMREFKIRGWKDITAMRMIIYRNCYLLLHGIAKVHKSELVWNDEHKGPLFFSQVHLQKLKVAITAAHADNQSDSKMMAAYSYFKYLICSCGLLPNPTIFIHLIGLSSECELGRMAFQMGSLIDSFVKIFGSVIGNQGREGTKGRTSFDDMQTVVVANLTSLLGGYGDRQPLMRSGNDMESSLANVYCEIESIRKENENSSSKAKKITFDSSDDEDCGSSQVSDCGAIVNEEDGEKEWKTDNVKKEIKEEIGEEEGEEKKKKKKKMKEEEKSESDDEEEEKRRKKKRKKQESESGSRNGWNDQSDIEEGEEERGELCAPSTYSDSTSKEFRSNLRELATESWKKNVELFGVKNEPSEKERLKMAQFIIGYLEEKYGDELLNVLQYFTCQSFSLQSFEKKSEVIGLVLYLDVRRLIAENFFFLIMASNDETVARRALDESEMCYKAQLNAVKIGRSISLGKQLHRELQTASGEAIAHSKNLEKYKYHVFFPRIVHESTMKNIYYAKVEENKAMSTEAIKKKKFNAEFWSKSSTLFNVESDWSTYEVRQSAVRVFAHMDELFKGKLIPMIKVMSGAGSVSSISDPSSCQSLVALNRMKAVGFFDGSLLFLLLRFDNKEAVEQSSLKLSQLCSGFTNVVQIGAKSKSLKTDAKFQSVKDNFSAKAKKINSECVQFYQTFFGSKGRKRYLSSSSTLDKSGEEEGEEEKEKKAKRKKKKMEKLIDEEEKMEEEPKAVEVDMKRVKIEEEEEEKKRERKKNKEKEESQYVEVDMRRVKDEEEEEKKRKRKEMKKEEEGEESDDCVIIEVPMKKVKVEKISDDEEKEEEKKKEKKKKSIGGESNGEKSKKSSSDGRIVKDEKDEDRSSNSISGWIKMAVDANLSNEGETVESGFSTFRSTLVQLSIGYWDHWLSKWDIQSDMSVDEKYSIAQSIIRFLEEKFGDEFHQILHIRTLIKFTPSDLQKKEEVIGLVMYVDRMKMASMMGFFVLLIALNDQDQCSTILPKCVECCRWNINRILIEHRSALGESISKDLNIAMRALNAAKNVMKLEFPIIFSSIIGARNSSESSEISVDKVERMITTPYVDGNWAKYSKKFGIKSEWSSYDVCDNAVNVFFCLNKLFKGKLITRLNEIYSKSPVSINQLKNVRSRKALMSLMNLNSLKIFPGGLIFLLLRNKNGNVLEEAVSKLFALIPSYLKYFDDFAPDFDFKCKNSGISKRSVELRGNSAAQQCLYLLRKSLQKEEGVMEVSTQSIPAAPIFKGGIPLSDSEEWKGNCKWRVATLWNRPESLHEWEKEKEKEMERLSNWIRDYHTNNVTRDEHYQAKLRVFNFIKSVLSEMMEKKKLTLSFTGSSLCTMAAYNSNLDVFADCRNSSVDRRKLLETLEKANGVTIVMDMSPFGGSIPLTISNEWTGNKLMEVRVHINPCTLYMSHVYQVVDGQDERVAPLAIVLKAWRILDPTCTSIGLRSFHVVALLIHFLQCGVSPPVLPGLVRLYPALDPTTFRDHNTMEIKPIPPENTQSLSSLLLGFFTYFADFEFEKYIISMREGCLYKRNISLCGSHITTVSIEHPYIPYQTRPDSIAAELDCMQLRAACKEARDSLQSSFRVPSIEDGN